LRVGQVKVLHRSGRMMDAKPMLPDLIHDAEASGHHGALAEVLVVAATVENALGMSDQSAAHADRAVSEAAKAGDDTQLCVALVTKAASRLVAGQPLEALGLCDAAEALAARGLPYPERVALVRGAALVAIGRTTDAIKVDEQTIAHAELTAK